MTSNLIDEWTSRSTCQDGNRPQALRDEVRMPRRSAERSRNHRPRQPSMLSHLLITGSVALICGVLGAMGYSHFFGPKPASRASSQSKTEAGSRQGIGPRITEPGDAPNAESARTAAAISRRQPDRPEADELKQQINEPQSEDRSARRAG